MRNPQEEVPDDTICAHCGTKLPENPQDGSWGYNGFCGPSCCLHYLLTISKVNKGINGMDATMGKKAIEEMRNGK